MFIVYPFNKYLLNVSFLQDTELAIEGKKGMGQSPHPSF